jgi:CBS domain-containing protein
MQVHEGMSRTVLTVGPGHTLQAVARLMSERRVGAAVVMDPDGHGPAIITERDILVAVGAGQDPEQETVAEHLTRDVVYASPEWSLEEAATAMVKGGFRHLIVLEGAETVGILSVRDVVRCWTEDGAICPVPARVAVG